ncbi:MAG: nucleotide exchange factor GrpE [Candidatus Methylomirabilia bacterium]
MNLQRTGRGRLCYRYPAGKMVTMINEEDELATTANLPDVCRDEPDASAGGDSGGDDAERLRADLAAVQERHLRLQAEFENYRKRQQRDREELNRQAKERVLGELPGIVDNLERALQHAAAAGAAPETLAQGVELVCRQLQEVLTRFGAEPIAALGALFDPHLHEAMARVETNGDPPDGTVIEEYRRGYMLDGKVLRPALVAVAKLANEEADQVP